MSSVKGLVLMSLLEYLEEKFGADQYREFLKKISSNDVNFIRQPVDGAFTYPDTLSCKFSISFTAQESEN